MPRCLTPQEARSFYDWFGAKLDTQAFYEDPGLDDLIAHAHFDQVHSLFEFGCGTGRFAARLLSEHLPDDCRYVGIDVSPTMVRLTTERLEPWAQRASARLTDGSTDLREPAGGVDCFVVVYVLDLLNPDDIRRVLASAHWMLAPAGRLCVMSLTFGQRGVARLVSSLWMALFSCCPRLVGGCRPLRLRDWVTPDRWRIDHHRVVTAFGISSEVIVASKA